MVPKANHKVAMAACFVSASVRVGMGFEIYNISDVLEILVGFNRVLLMFHVFFNPGMFSKTQRRFLSGARCPRCAWTRAIP